MSSFKLRTCRWLAPVALVGALGLAACGDDDASVSTGAADVGAAAGSDQHLVNQAAEIAERSDAAVGSDQHLENQAAEIADRSDSDAPNAWEAGDRAASARLTGEAERYLESQHQADEVGSPGDRMPGSHHPPVG
jgi:hypothetical protein